MDTPQLGESSEPRSSRTRIKSQRAIEAETTVRLLARARKAEAENNNNDNEALVGSSNKKTPGSGRKAKSTTKPRKAGKKQEVYCICKKPTSEDDGPMIECAECNDW